MKELDNLTTKNYEVAILLPCCDEEAAIASVVQDFKQYLPDASIYVYDN